MGFKKVYKCFMDIFPQLLLSRTLRMWTQLRRLFCLRLCLTYLNEPWLVVLPHGIGALLCKQMKVAVRCKVAFADSASAQT
ncbi:hypothetical protein ES319_D05G388100v1 [Gossypium barbadense]|uniref:Uncharacterized protein n=2 Tax=Gossypium TaxID=3633 RepID=A0A5J5RQP3_GOSBA|nr:hypothetical protein ES319_D05G388100v1 [Gossypium barbadense]TYG71624.1 hypothetical protein ES288_D05G412000v1 [Gossypium darwinii]